VDNAQDPKKKRFYENAHCRLEETFPDLLEKAQDTLENPENPEVLKTLEEAEGAFSKAMDVVGRSTRQPTLPENSLRLKKCLEDLEDAKKRNNTNDIAEKA